jgi:putative SOS response-associated peptidase YedK
MCGRFTSTASPEELMRKFGVTILQNLRPKWNVAPSQQALVIARHGLQNEAVMAQWGLPPASAKHSFLINARAETVTEKPTFRDAFHHRRCLVVASGWYEWSAPKTPWHIQLCDGGVMAFGGLLFGPPGQQHFVIMTTRADAGLGDIHLRAPLVLAANDFDAWVGSDVSAAAALLRPAPATWFNWYRVGADVGKVSQDHPALVTPLTEEALRPQAAPQGDLFA